MNTLPNDIKIKLLTKVKISAIMHTKMHLKWEYMPTVHVEWSYLVQRAQKANINDNNKNDILVAIFKMCKIMLF